MATLAQLQAEPWWGNEIVPATLDKVFRDLCRWAGTNPAGGGTKGNEFHPTGRHRSLEWVLNSRYCTNRSYGTVDARDRRGNWRHIRAFDVPLPRHLMIAVSTRLDTAVRAGRAQKVAEWFGTKDGVNVHGWYEGRPSTSDNSHLTHVHVGLWTENADDDHTDLYEILTGDDMALRDDPDGLIMMYRMEGLAHMKATVDIPGHGVRPIQTVAAINDLAKRLAAVEAKPPVQSAPVDPATLKAVLLDPEVLAAQAKANADENARRQAD